MDSGAQSFSVSVIIPVYNAEETLERAVRSALAQPEAGQVILIDDESSDGSQDIAWKLAGEDSRILYHRFQVNRGPAAARNKGIELSQGTWVALLDADDYWQNGRLEKLLPYVDGYDVLADDLLLEGDAGSLFHVEQGQIQPVNLKTYLLSNLPQKGKTNMF